MKITTGQRVTSFISEVESVVKQVKDMGEGISNVAVILKIINSLPSKFVTAWNTVDLAKRNLEDLIA